MYISRGHLFKRQLCIISATIILTAYLDDVILNLFSNTQSSSSESESRLLVNDSLSKPAFPINIHALYNYLSGGSTPSDVIKNESKANENKHTSSSSSSQTSIIRVSQQYNNNSSEVSHDPSSDPRRKKITKDEIQRIGPSLESFHQWSQYLHFSIYKKGVPLEANAVHFRDDNNETSYYYEGFSFVPPNISSWESNASLWDRRGRFPSVEERIKFYMGRWYNCGNNPNIFDERFRSQMDRQVNDTEQMKPGNNLVVNPLGLDPRRIYEFTKQRRGSSSRLEKTTVHRLKQTYFRDIVDLAILRNETTDYSDVVPVIIHVGDGVSIARKDFINGSYPVFAKVRDLVAENKENHCRTLRARCRGRHSTIIWPMNRGRHLKPASYIPKEDVSWEEKEGKLVWRGGAFGLRDADFKEEDAKEEEMVKDSWKQRIDLVSHHLKSKLVDAKFVDKQNNHLLPASHIRPKKPRRKMARFKYLLSVEGNDVSSGLKWMLMSNSVVFLPPIQYVSWAMESYLEPFVHYVPVHANMSNLEDMVMWANQHDDEVKRIAERSTLFIYDLLFHPDAYRDEELILEGIMKRYQKCFGGAANH